MAGEIKPPTAKSDLGSRVTRPRDVTRDLLQRADQQRVQQAARINPVEQARTTQGETVSGQTSQLDAAQGISGGDRVHRPLRDVQQGGHQPEIRNISPTEQVVLTPGTKALETLTHKQGQNDLHYLADCGIVSSETVVHQFKSDVYGGITENDMVKVAENAGLIGPDGASTFEELRGLLGKYQISTRIESNVTVDQLTQFVEQGRGVIIAVNSGELWNDLSHIQNGQTNHAVTVIGVARELLPNGQAGAVKGFIINDSGRAYYDHFVPVDTMQAAFVKVRSEVILRGDKNPLPAGVALVTVDQQSRS